MSRVLIAFASADGQTFRIAARIAAALGRAGHAVTVMRADAPGIDHAIAASDTVVVGGGIRYGHHARALERAVRDNRAALGARPNAFFSVSLSGGGPGARPATAQGYVEQFVARTGWKPRRAATFGGALLYTRYSFLIRLLMRHIVGSAGGETDTSRDYEYTDWSAVDRFAAELAQTD